MQKKDNLIRIYTGREVTALILKSELEQSGISAIIQDDFKSGVSAGFYGGTPSSIDLFIEESDFKKAEPIIREFMEKNAD